jgi:hypothetical protein
VLAETSILRAADADNPYRYVFATGAGHVDGRVVNQTLPEALLWLWQGYPIR